MDSTRTKAAPVKVETHPTTTYPHMLNFYDRPPLMDITMDEFETWAIDRLRVLAEIEASFVRNRSFEDLKNVTQAQSAKYLPLSSNSAYLRDLQGERLKDHVSHFILRLAFCRTEELKRRFVKAETTLFRIRYESESEAGKREFLASRGSAHAEEVSANEKRLYKTQLIAATPGITAPTFEDEKFVKVGGFSHLHLTKSVNILSCVWN
ncbi:hypothetical protein FRC03_008567 [Tulasnella sp. 419]|nr:hypothetical protein FRC03_008567 [Tulasnella sp. 419]